MNAARGGESPGPSGRGLGGAAAGIPAGGRRRKKKPKPVGKEGLPRERVNSDASSQKPTPIILRAGADNPSQDSDRATPTERSSRQQRPVSPSPQIKIKVRDAPSHSQSTPGSAAGSPSHAGGATPPSQTPTTPGSQGKHGGNGEHRGRDGTPSGRLFTPGQRVTGGSIPGISIEVPIHKRLAAPPTMTQAVRLVDNAFQWVDNGTEFLLDQMDFLVIGILGLQGSGKSTVMSLLAGSEHGDDPSSFVFQPQSSSSSEQAGHQTLGVDMYITEERVILLDTQPVLSPALLDRLLGPEKQSIPPEYSSPENYAEMQSLHIAAFLLTTCHVVIVLEDWFGDVNLVEFLKRAEMLKPATPPPSSSQSENSLQEDPEDFVPNIVFVENKASRESFQPVTVHAMEQALHSLMATSKLKYTGCSSISRSGVMPCLNPKTLPLDVNLFLLPQLNKEGDKAPANKDTRSTLMQHLPEPSFKGHPKTERLVSAFRHQLYATSRPPILHTTLTEKNWYQYASRTWEGLKKSTLLSEYHRLLTG